MGESRNDTDGGISGSDEVGGSEGRGSHEAVAEQPGQPIFQDTTGQSVTLDQIETVGVTIMIPTHEMVPFWFAYSLATCMTYTTIAHPYVDFSLYGANGTIIQNLRNGLVQNFLQTKNAWSMWFDSDMRFPRDTIERLLLHQQPIVGCNYPTRKWPAIEPVCHGFGGEVKENGSTDWNTNRIYPGKGLESVRAAGFGCMLVHRDVYEAMEPPWFHLPWDEKAGKHSSGEDAYFCWKAKQAGFDTLIDHDLSNEVAHIGMREYTLADAEMQRADILEHRKALDVGGFN